MSANASATFYSYQLQKLFFDKKVSQRKARDTNVRIYIRQEDAKEFSQVGPSCMISELSVKYSIKRDFDVQVMYTFVQQERAMNEYRDVC